MLKHILSLGVSDQNFEVDWATYRYRHMAFYLKIKNKQTKPSNDDCETVTHFDDLASIITHRREEVIVCIPSPAEAHQSVRSMELKVGLSNPDSCFTTV